MPDAGLDVVTMGGVPVTSVVFFTPWGWWRRTRIRAGNDIAPPSINPLALGWWNTQSGSQSPRPTLMERGYWATYMTPSVFSQLMTEHELTPPAGYGHLTH